MKFDTEGTYTLLYTATDECGNETEETREVIVGNPRTVLYTDGTLIINESPKDKTKNEQLHGVATNEYAPLDPNGTGLSAYDFPQSDSALWHSEASQITSVEIGSHIAPKYLQSWFADCVNCRDFGINGMDTSKATSTKWMFLGCSTATTINVTGLDTSSVTDMSDMFYGCSALTNLDLSGFNTSSVTTMSRMFYYCLALATLDVSSFNTSSVTDMSDMFYGCSALTNLDLSGFNTSSVTTMSRMFYYCLALATLDVSSFNTSSVTDMSDMFSGCSALATLDVSSFNTSNVTTMYDMFSACRALTSLNLSSFNTSNVTIMEQMFYNCKALTTIYVSLSFVVAQVTSSRSMFASMSTNLVGGAGTRWNSSNPGDKTYAHIDGGTSNPGYFTAKA